MVKIRLADKIADQLEEMIAAGTLRPGEKLPAERQLAEQLSVSRPSLREAIQKLASKGLLETRRGGGTYVLTDLQPEYVEPLVELFRNQPESRYDVLEVRHALEGNAAYYAALRATDADLENIRNKFEDMIKCHGDPDPMVEARADAQFHLSIVEASHNLVLVHMMNSLFNLLQSSVSHNLDKLYTIHRVFDPLSKQHKELMEAVMARDPERAQKAAGDHLTFVEDSLQKIDRDELRKTRAMNRLNALQPLK